MAQCGVGTEHVRDRFPPIASITQALQFRTVMLVLGGNRAGTGAISELQANSIGGGLTGFDIMFNCVAYMDEYNCSGVFRDGSNGEDL